MIDYTDKETIKNILRRYKRIEEESKRGNYEAMELIIDIERAIEQIHLSITEAEVLLYILQGSTEIEIAQTIGVSQQWISQVFNSIVDKLEEVTI